MKETSLGYKLDQWIKAKEEDFKSGEFSGETLKNYKGYVRNYYKKFKIESNGNAGWTNNQDDPFLLINWNVTEIRKTEIAKFKKELMKIEKLKIKTKKNILNALHAFFTWLATEDPDELISLKDIPDFPKFQGMILNLVKLLIMICKLKEFKIFLKNTEILLNSVARNFYARRTVCFKN